MSLASFLVPAGSKAVDSELDALFKDAALVEPPTNKRKAAVQETDEPTPKRTKQAKAPHKHAANESDAEDDARAADPEDDPMDTPYTPPAHISTSNSASKHPKNPNAKWAPDGETPAQRDARTLFVGNVPVEVMTRKPLIKALQRHLLSAYPNARAESIRFRNVPVPVKEKEKKPEEEKDDDTKSKKGNPHPHAKTGAGPTKPTHNERTAAWRMAAKETDPDDSTPSAKTYLTAAEKKRIAAITGEVGMGGAGSITAYLLLAHPTPQRRTNLPPLPTADPYAAAVGIASRLDGVIWIPEVNAERVEGTEGRRLRVDVANPNASAMVRAAAAVAPAPVDAIATPVDASIATSDSAPVDAAGTTATADPATTFAAVDLTPNTALLTADLTVDLTALLPDPKRTLFVGNLDYGAKEDDVRAFFEGEVERLMAEGESEGEGEGESDSDAGASSEGGVDEGEDGEDESEEEEEQEGDAPTTPPTAATTTTHVARVRIVRDPATGVGKGFAYVQFVDRTPVDELLALPLGALRFAKRKLRVQRCKTVPGGRGVGAANKERDGKSSSAAGKPGKPGTTSHERGSTAAGKPGTRQGRTPDAGWGARPGSSSARPGSSSTRNPNASSTSRTTLPIPSGDPTLGLRLAGLPKDARKAAKAADAARVARRAAKKMAAKGKGGGKGESCFLKRGGKGAGAGGTDAGANNRSGDKPNAKDRFGDKPNAKVRFDKRKARMAMGGKMEGKERVRVRKEKDTRGVGGDAKKSGKNKAKYAKSTGKDKKHSSGKDKKRARVAAEGKRGGKK